MVTTTIKISLETKDRLVAKKLTRSETYEEILIRILNGLEEKTNEPISTNL